jgi:hypothetical protein
MNTTILSVADPVWANAEQTRINCEIVTEQYPGEVLPFTADPNDCTEYGPQIYADCVAGKYGTVAPYVAPITPAEQNKAMAQQRLAATDWVNQPDVYDPSITPHLTNRDAFISYRAAVRAIAVNPVAGNLNWPTEPAPVWSQA